jgi:hypothetical protein
VEGILRQAADVEEVDKRLQEYEQGLYNFIISFLADTVTWLHWQLLCLGFLVLINACTL